MPAFRAAGTTVFSSANNIANPNALAPTASGSRVVGDLLLCFTWSRSITATVATPSGWTILPGTWPQRHTTASAGSLYIFYRTADGTAADNASISWSGVATGTSGDACGAAILAYSAMSVTQDATLVKSNLTAQGASSVIPAITTATDNAMAIGFALKVGAESGTSTVTTRTERVDGFTANGTGHVVEICDLVKTPAGAVATTTVTWSLTTSLPVLAVSIACQAGATAVNGNALTLKSDVAAEVNGNALTLTSDTAAEVSSAAAYLWDVSSTVDAAALSLKWDVEVPAAFDPLDLSPAIWYDASDTASVTTSGGSVSQWNDKSGNARHATQATSGLWPVHGTVSLNGQPTITFDGVDDSLNLPTLAALTAGTVFVVVKTAVDPAATAAKSGLWLLGSPNTDTHYPFTDGIIYDQFGTTVRKTTVNPTLTLAAWRIYEVVSATNDWRNYLDGTLLFSTATNTAGFSTVPRVGKSNSRFLPGDIAEFLLFPTALSAGDRDDVRAYLEDKWGLGVPATTPVDGDALDLKWDIATTVNAAASSLKWDVATTVNAAAQSLKWDVAAQVNVSPTALKWDVSASVNATARSLLWDMVAQVAAPARTLKWDVAAAVSATTALKWDLAAAVNSTTQSLKWDVAAGIGAVNAAPVALNWDVATTVNAVTASLKWDLAATATAAPRVLLWDLRSEVTSASQRLVWDLAGAVPASARTLKWDLAAQATSSLSLVWDVITVGLVSGLPLNVTWDLNAQVASLTRTLKWDLATMVNATARTLKWDLGAAVLAPARTVKWDLGAAVVATRTLKWDVGGTLPPTVSTVRYMARAETLAARLDVLESA